jgi:hypothetical protein
MVYRKTLRISSAAKAKFNTGEITNYQSADANCIALTLPMIHMVSQKKKKKNKEKRKRKRKKEKKKKRKKGKKEQTKFIHRPLLCYSCSLNAYM